MERFKSRVEIQTKNNPNLCDELRASLGTSINLSNGCSLHLVDDFGVTWGAGPYGQDWCCKTEDWLQSVLSWINYWNEDRTETGYLISN